MFWNFYQIVYVFLSQVLLDRSGFYAVTSCSDKSLSLYDFELGECVAGMVGHSGKNAQKKTPPIYII